MASNSENISIWWRHHVQVPPEYKPVEFVLFCLRRELGLSQFTDIKSCKKESQHILLNILWCLGWNCLFLPIFILVTASRHLQIMVSNFYCLQICVSSKQCFCRSLQMSIFNFTLVMKNVVFWYKFPWNLLLKVQLKAMQIMACHGRGLKLLS